MAAQVAGQPAHLAQIVENLAGGGLQQARLRRGMQLSPNPGEQAETQLGLGMMQRLGRRRLSDVQQPGGAGDRAGLQDCLEDLDMTQPHELSQLGQDECGDGTAPFRATTRRRPIA